MAYANMYNTCRFMGRVVGSSVKTGSFNAGGKTVPTVSFSIAVPKKLTTEQRNAAKNDKSIKTADFVNCRAVGPLADLFNKVFNANGKVIIVDTLYSTWESTNQQTGQKTYGHNFDVVDMYWPISEGQNNGGNNNGNSGNGNSYSNNNNNSGNSSSNNISNFEMFPSDDLPF